MSPSSSCDLDKGPETKVIGGGEYHRRRVRNLCVYIVAVFLSVIGGLALKVIFERFGYPKWMK